MSSWTWPLSRAARRQHSRLSFPWSRFPYRHVTIATLITSLLYLFYIFVIPQILKFRFRLDLSWYDLGFYGFGPSQSYVSFEYESPLVEITEWDSGCDARFTFLAPRGDSIAHPGPVILDAQGELVWMKYNLGTTQDFRVQRYKDADFLTYWEGLEVDGHGSGSWYMLDSSYTQRYVVSPVGFAGGDLHEFHITENGTALVTIYDPTPADLTDLGGPTLSWIWDCIVQEINIETGELIFEWRASEHYSINATFMPFSETGTKAAPFDVFHINSVEKDEQGNYLISLRHLHMISYIDGHTGDVLWTFGGKLNDFTDLSGGQATSFSWQHDARWHSNNTMTLLNNAARTNTDPAPESWGMLIQLDVPAREVRLLETYYHPQQIRAMSQGNVQVLDDGGRLVIGWGQSAAFTEFTADGRLLCDVHFGASAYFTFARTQSYRVFKDSWVGRPESTPDVGVVGDHVYVSWNGATEVVAWRLDVWVSDDNDDRTFEPVSLFEKTGFETEIKIPEGLNHPLFHLAALDAKGNVLGVSEVPPSKPEYSMEELLNLPKWILAVAIIMSSAGLLFSLFRFCGCCRLVGRFRSRFNKYQLVQSINEGRHSDDSHMEYRIPLNENTV